MTGQQFNAAAVEWVMRSAPRGIPPRAIWTLAVMASLTGPDGRGAHPSAEQLARLARRGVRSVQRDLDELAKHGMLQPGDPRAVKGLRAGHRPDVWDLPPAACDYLTARLRDAKLAPQAAKLAPHPKDKRGLPPWCGQCHERTRFVLDEHGEAGNQKCPVCSSPAPRRLQ